jgi:uncharacterized protein (DUF1501 family)
MLRPYKYQQRMLAYKILTMNRRQFLIQSGLVSASTLVSIGLHGLAVQSAAPNKNNKRLIVIFLRGAIDGLNVIVPYQEANYYQSRPKIAIPKPGLQGGAIDLDGRFGLHPALGAIAPLWRQKTLAFVHACGSPDPSRSHFDAQDYMETGTPGKKTTSDGWMNRLLSVMRADSPVQALNPAATTPRILSGKMPVASFPLGRNANRPIALDRPQIAGAFDRLYGDSDQLGEAYRESRAARQTLLADLNAEMTAADNGAPPASGFPGDAMQLGRLMARNSNIQLAFLALGGWDTHVNQGSSRGQLADRLRPLGQGLANLVRGLGGVYGDSAIAVISEFGRTVRENGNAGTDHGHGNAMWILGGKIQGGKVYGEWPGLDESQLYQQRDLAVTTDFRDAIATLLQGHLGLDEGKCDRVFPGYKSTPIVGLI